jgi:hypothetical protein
MMMRKNRMGIEAKINDRRRVTRHYIYINLSIIMYVKKQQHV